MRPPRQRWFDALILPRRFGLERARIRASTWRWGIATTSSIWLLLGLGLIWVAALRWIPALQPYGGPGWLLWLGLGSSVAFPALGYQAGLLIDGWPWRGPAWRLGMAALFLLIAGLIASSAAAWVGLLGWLWSGGPRA
jgi:hypothetical protein